MAKSIDMTQGKPSGQIIRFAILLILGNLFQQVYFKEGKILHWGMSEAGEEDIRKADTVCHLTAVQNKYNMLDRKQEALFPTLKE